MGLGWDVGWLSTTWGVWVGAWSKGREFEAGRGAGLGLMWRPPIRLFFCNFFNKLPSQATPQPKPRHTPRTRHSPVGGAPTPRVNSCPQPKPHRTPSYRLILGMKSITNID
ncbi:hypothetical protein Hanom_Chr06g00541891 [Helianthus anomalus]